jgi:hypothetical protein
VARAATSKALRRCLALLACAILLGVSQAASADDQEQAVPESVAVGDTADVVTSRIVNVTEGVSVGDGTSTNPGEMVSVGEGVSVGDGTGVHPGEMVSVGEGVSVGDGTNVYPGRNVAVGEGVNVGDGTNVYPGRIVGVEEGVEVGDGTDAHAVNTQPILHVTDFNGDEGSAASAAGSIEDPDPQQWTATVDYGDGSGVQPLPLLQDQTFTLSHVYDDNGTYAVTVTVNDGHGGTDTKTVDATIANVAPDAKLSNGGPVDEGSPAQISFSNQHDPSNLDTQAGFSYRYACDGQNLGQPTSNSTASCTFDDASTHTVLARISDKDGGFSDYTTAVEVHNVAPTAALSNDGPVAESSPATISFSNQHDASSADEQAGFTYRYACDGQNLGAPTSLASSPCAFDDGPSSHTVLARIEDKDGGFSDYTTAVDVTNAPPSGTLGNAGPVDEGSPVSVSWSGQSDPSTADTQVGFTYRYACNGQTLGAPTSAATTTCTFDDGPSSHTVLSRIIDKDGGFAERTTNVSVRNVAPVATLVAPTTAVNEGSTFTLNLVNASDVSQADTAAGFRLEFDCGTGAGYTPNHTCKAIDNPSQAVKARITDKDGSSTEYAATVPVANAPPVPAITTPPSGALYKIGDPVTVTGTFTDPGIQDTHTATWSFDGVSIPGSVSEANGVGSTSAVTSFSVAGVYTVRLTVTDNSGASGTASTVNGTEVLIVVYDPSAGFVTGVGWINSPVGAYRSDPQVGGKATFGFVCKYVMGATAPTGSTEFHLHATRFDFNSASYQWLVVAGSKAQFKGIGEVNGIGGYGFLLTAYDGNPDRLRLKVWDAGGNIVYDNALGSSDDIDAANPQAIAAGQIIVRR